MTRETLVAFATLVGSLAAIGYMVSFWLRFRDELDRLEAEERRMDLRQRLEAEKAAAVVQPDSDLVRQMYANGYISRETRSQWWDEIVGPSPVDAVEPPKPRHCDRCGGPTADANDRCLYCQSPLTEGT